MIKLVKAQYKAWRKARAISRFRLDNRKAKKENVWENKTTRIFSFRVNVVY